MSFLGTWYAALLVLIVFACLAGKASGKGLLGILIDGRGRYSLNHLQIVLWTLLVLSTLVALFIDSGFAAKPALDIPKTLLLLMGISVGSAATAGAIKSGKDVRNAAVQKQGVLPAAAVIPGGQLVLPPRPAQVVLQEEGPLIDQVVDVTKFQNLIFTLVIMGVYVTLLIKAKGSPAYPDLDSVQNLLWLLGVSHAGYLAGKLPDKPTQSNGGAISAAVAARGSGPLTTRAALAPPPVAPGPVPPPTWENRIRDYFTVSDVSHMLQNPGHSAHPLDLGDYQSVKANGQRIYNAVASDAMPLPPSEKWPTYMKDDFKAWMEAGFPQFSLREEPLSQGQQRSMPVGKRQMISNRVVAKNRFALNVTIAPGTGAGAALRRSLNAGAPVMAEAEADAVAGQQAPSPADDLHYHGGTILPDLTFTNFFLGGEGAWQATDVANIDRALADAMSDVGLNNVLVQYYFGRQITSSFSPSRFLPGPKPDTVSRGDIEEIVNQVHDAGLLDQFDLSSTVFNLMLPGGTILTTDGTPSGAFAGGGQNVGHAVADEEEDKADSTLGLGGYHGSVQAGGDTVYFAVGVFSEILPDGTSNGIPVFNEPWKNVVATFYHELCEARTDPDVERANQTGDSSLLGWVSSAGEEIGDFALNGRVPLNEVIREVPLTNGGGTVPIQFEFSNFSHAPEGPANQPRPPVAA